jgi:hypothetical protein
MVKSIEDKHGKVSSYFLDAEAKTIVNMGPFLPERKIYAPMIEGRVTKAKLKSAWLVYLRALLEPGYVDGSLEKVYFVTLTYRNIPKWGQDENAPGMVRVGRAIDNFGESIAAVGGRAFFGEEFGTRAGRVHHHGIVVSSQKLINDEDVKFGVVGTLQMKLMEWGFRNGFYEVKEVNPELMREDTNDHRVLLYCLKYTIKEQGRWWVFNTAPVKEGMI